MAQALSNQYIDRYRTLGDTVVFFSVVPRGLGMSHCNFRQHSNAFNSQLRQSSSGVSHLAYFQHLHLDRLLYCSRDGVHFDQNEELKFYLSLRLLAVKKCWRVLEYVQRDIH